MQRSYRNLSSLNFDSLHKQDKKFRRESQDSKTPHTRPQSNNLLKLWLTCREVQLSKIRNVDSEVGLIYLPSFNNCMNAANCALPLPVPQPMGIRWDQATFVWWFFLVESFQCSVENTPIFKQIGGLNPANHVCGILQHWKISPADLEFLGMKLMSMTPISI